MSAASDGLAALSDLARKVGAGAAGAGHPEIGTALAIASVALAAGSRAAAAGKDPLDEVTALLSPKEAVADVHQQWDAAIADRFPKSDPPE